MLGRQITACVAWDELAWRGTWSMFWRRVTWCYVKRRQGFMRELVCDFWTRTDLRWYGTIVLDRDEIYESEKIPEESWQANAAPYKRKRPVSSRGEWRVENCPTVFSPPWLCIHLFRVPFVFFRKREECSASSEQLSRSAGLIKSFLEGCPPINPSCSQSAKHHCIQPTSPDLFLPMLAPKLSAYRTPLVLLATRT